MVSSSDAWHPPPGINPKAGVTRATNPLAGQVLCEHLMHDIAMQYVIGASPKPVHCHELATRLQATRQLTRHRRQSIDGKIVAQLAKDHQIKRTVRWPVPDIVLINLDVTQLSASFFRASDSGLSDVACD
jgi:hypothetical protein